VVLLLAAGILALVSATPAVVVAQSYLDRWVALAVKVTMEELIQVFMEYLAQYLKLVHMHQLNALALELLAAKVPTNIVE